MKLSTLLKTRNTWLAQADEEDHILLATLGRLTRSLSHHVFPGWSTEEARRAALEELRPHIRALTGFKTAFHADMASLAHHERKLLLERKLISPSMAARREACEILIPKKQDMSIMLNEEEHLVMHSFAAGEALDEQRAKLEKIALLVEEKIDFAKSQSGDYLCSIPTECGNGIQMYLVMHLPALVIANLMKEIDKAIEKLGLQISPFYSDGNRDTGDSFVIYTTPCSLMQCEHEIAKLKRVAKTLVLREKQVRGKLYNLRPLELRDQVTRALGRLVYATTLTFTEMSNAVSLLILGTKYGFLRWQPEQGEEILATLRQMNISLAPAHLAQACGLCCSEHDAKEMAALRAKLIQEQLATLHVSINPIKSSLSHTKV